jgi:hypothetical protein
MKTYTRPGMLYASMAWRPTMKEELRMLEKVQRRIIGMARHLGEGSYEEKCRWAGINTVEQELAVKDMAMTNRIMQHKVNVDRRRYWELESEWPLRAQEGGGGRGSGSSRS